MIHTKHSKTLAVEKKTIVRKIERDNLTNCAVTKASSIGDEDYNFIGLEKWYRNFLQRALLRVQTILPWIADDKVFVFIAIARKITVEPRWACSIWTYIRHISCTSCKTQQIQERFDSMKEKSDVRIKARILWEKTIAESMPPILSL